MNEPNHSENLLASWTLRRPSPELRAKIFSAESKNAEKPCWKTALNWLAPAAICAFALVLSLGIHSRSHAPFGKTDTNLFFASITMNSVTASNTDTSLSDFSLSKSDMNLEQNVWRMATFASTNHDQTHSSMVSLPSGKTNFLIR